LSLSGKVWPIHLPPEEGECLTSWIARSAVYHFAVPSTFFAKTVPSKPDAWKQDLDIKCHPEILRAVSEKCCQNISVIESLTISSLIQNIYIPSEKSTALPRWVGPMRIRRSTTHHYGLRACIVCLRENAFYKLQWRFSYFIACPVHNIKMIDECQYCNASLTTHSISKLHFDESPLDALAYCDCCGFDLRNSVTTAAKKRETEIVYFLLMTAEKGYVEINNSVAYSHLYFQGLRLIIRGILRLLDRTDIRFKINKSLYEIPENFEIEFLRVGEMSNILDVSMKLMEDWPESFITFSRVNSLYYQDWIRPRDVSPYWFYHVVRLFRRWS
jgi:hypothetical protein